MHKNVINCPPYAPVLMESTRAIGYSIESAVADIIDNSIAAKAKSIDIFFDTNSTPFIAIIDDGVGMDSSTITEAMRYGSTSPTEQRDANDLGRYGLGLKTASLSQCRRLTVVSKQGNSYEARRWDLDYILHTKQWSLEQLTEEEMQALPAISHLNSKEHGTLVLWQKLDKIQLGGLSVEKSVESKMQSTKEHLELVFHRFLAGEGSAKLKIAINNIKLEPFDPFFAAKSTKVMDDERIDLPGREGRVIVKPYVLPHPSNMTEEELKKYGGKDGLRNLQGFYIYRNKRLLTWGTCFRLRKMDEFSKLARVMVDIPNSLDDLWTLDVKKSTAYPPEIVKTRLKELLKNITAGSKRTFGFRQRKEVADNITHVWEKIETREGVKYAVNLEHPILESLNSKLDEESKAMLSQYIETIQNNLPFNNLHYDMHSDVKIKKDSEEDEKERVIAMARVIIKEAIANEHIEDTMDGFETVEPFMDYLEDINELYKEMKING